MISLNDYIQKDTLIKEEFILQISDDIWKLGDQIAPSSFFGEKLR